MVFRNWFSKEIAKLGRIEKKEWNARIFSYIVLVFAALLYWKWCYSLPSSGKAVLALAMLAALMPLRDGASWLEKAIWIALLFAFFYMEDIAITKEHRDAAHDQAIALKTLSDGFSKVLTDEQTNFGKVLEAQQSNFKKVLEQGQKNFQSTLSQAIIAQKNESQRFDALLQKQDQLFTRQEELAASLNGTLVPASDKPSHVCPFSDLQGRTSIFLGKGEYLIRVNICLTHMCL